MGQRKYKDKSTNEEEKKMYRRIANMLGHALLALDELKMGETFLRAILHPLFFFSRSLTPSSKPELGFFCSENGERTLLFTH